MDLFACEMQEFVFFDIMNQPDRFSLGRDKIEKAPGDIGWEIQKFNGDGVAGVEISQQPAVEFFGFQEILNLVQV